MSRAARTTSGGLHHHQSDQPREKMPVRMCNGCPRPLSRYNPNSLCASCSAERARLYGVGR